jgi:hypothetical protein
MGSKGFCNVARAGFNLVEGGLDPARITDWLPVHTHLMTNFAFNVCILRDKGAK